MAWQTPRGVQSPLSASRSRQRITRRPRRTIGRLCCPIARTRVFVMRVVGQRDRPGREAGLRYSAGRAPRGCGRSLLQSLLETGRGLTTNSNEGPVVLQDGGPEAPSFDAQYIHSVVQARTQPRACRLQDGSPEAPTSGSTARPATDSAAGTNKTTNNSNQSRPKSVGAEFLSI